MWRQIIANTHKKTYSLSLSLSFSLFYEHSYRKYSKHVQQHILNRRPVLSLLSFKQPPKIADSSHPLWSSIGTGTSSRFCRWLATFGSSPRYRIPIIEWPIEYGCNEGHTNTSAEYRDHETEVLPNISQNKADNCKKSNNQLAHSLR